MRLSFFPLAGMMTIAVAFSAATAAQKPAGHLFKTSNECVACHNGLTTSSGEDVSIGSNWRASMMANSSRDPYWQAAVRKEIVDHPSASTAIQDECAVCHMPMSRTEAHTAGKTGNVFEHLPVASEGDGEDRLAHDGVSCSLCHQITGRNLGTGASFTGGYIVNGLSAEPRAMFGPFEIEKGLQRIMRSATSFQPTEGLHIRRSELCATCHTLITKALGPSGEVIGELPEQMPFLEWQNSAYVSEQRSCQSCHMPVVEEEIPIASVFGAPRKGFARHTFIGGNFFMQRMLARFRNELGVPALPHELEVAARDTARNLTSATAKVSIERAEIAQTRLTIEVAVRNLTGHKFPTGYPSRRAWLHLTVRDRSGRIVFESGAVAPNGAISGNDNDRDAFGVEPHYREIREVEQVQIYESVMGDAGGRPTTGLLSAVRYLKDNRLLPRGFDKASAEPRIAVLGEALRDADFAGNGDSLRYSLDVTNGEGPFHAEIELRFQVISFRWAENLKPYKTEETNRFVRYYESMASSSSEMLSSDSATIR
jgi:cytochrome c551/c552